GILFTAVLVGLGCGLVNGVLIAYGGMVPFIATLAMLASARGLALQITDGRTQIVTVGSVLDLGERDAYVLGVPPLVLVFAAVTVIGWLLLNRTTFGRRTVAVGGNAEAARLAGIDVRRQQLYLYLLSGLCCGIAAFLLIVLAGSGQNTNGNLYELDAIAAAIIGGTLLTGGRGTIVGSVLGVLIFTTITNIFALNNLQSDVQQIAKGAIIVAAVLVQRRTASTTEERVHRHAQAHAVHEPQRAALRSRRRVRRCPGHRLHQQRAEREGARRGQPAGRRRQAGQAGHHRLRRTAGRPRLAQRHQRQRQEARREVQRRHPGDHRGLQRHRAADRPDRDPHQQEGRRAGRAARRRQGPHPGRAEGDAGRHPRRQPRPDLQHPAGLPLLDRRR